MRYDIGHRNWRTREFVILAGVLFLIVVVTRGFEPILLLIAPFSALVSIMFDLFGVVRTNYAILHESHMDFRHGEGYFGAGWLKTRVPYATIDEIVVRDSSVRVGYFPRLSGGRLSTHTSWLEFEPVNQTEFVADLRRRVAEARGIQQKTGRQSGPL